MTGFEIVMVSSIIGILICVVLLDSRTRELKYEIEKLRRQIRADSEAEEKEI